MFFDSIRESSDRIKEHKIRAKTETRNQGKNINLTGNSFNFDEPQVLNDSN